MSCHEGLRNCSTSAVGVSIVVLAIRSSFVKYLLSQNPFALKDPVNHLFPDVLFHQELTGLWTTSGREREGQLNGDFAEFPETNKCQAPFRQVTNAFGHCLCHVICLQHFSIFFLCASCLKQTAARSLFPPNHTWSPPLLGDKTDGREDSLVSSCVRHFNVKSLKIA